MDFAFEVRKPLRSIPDVGQVLMRVTMALRGSAMTLRLSDHAVPAVVVSGYKWKKMGRSDVHRSEPYVWGAWWDSGSRDYRATDISSKGPNILAFPNWMTSAEVAELRARCAANGSDTAAIGAEIISTMRALADRFPEIGRDVLTIAIPSPFAGQPIELRYDGAASELGGWTPWIVMPSYVSRPSPATNGLAWKIGPWRMQTVAPDGPPGGPKFGFGAETWRRRPPK
jgi:hypothetical protein